MNQSSNTSRSQCSMCSSKNRVNLCAISNFLLTGHSIGYICPVCFGYLIATRRIAQQRQALKPDNHSCSSLNHPIPQEIINCAENPWKTIIVNQLSKTIDYEILFSLFLQYGMIENFYFCETEELIDKRQYQGFAIITFSSEVDARRVYEASQQKLIRFNGCELVMTLASDDYCPIQHLPDECLREIFLHLPSLEDQSSINKVCKRWKSVESMIWSEITQVTDCDWDWQNISHRTGRSLRDVYLTLMEMNSEEAVAILSAVADKCMYMENFLGELLEIDPSQCNSYFRSIIARNKNLRRLYLRAIDFDESFINSFPPGLEHMHLFAKSNDLSFGVGPVDLSRFQNLQVLALYDFIIHKNQLQGIENLDNLRRLKFDGSTVHRSNIKKIVNFTKLEYLSIPNCQITNRTLVKILKNNKGLKFLDISDIDDITDSTIKYAYKLPELKSLYMKNLNLVTDKYITGIPKLEILDCSGCISITDKGVQQLFTSPPPTADSLDLYISDYSISMVSLKAGAKWAKRHNKLLIIRSDEEFVEQWKNARRGRSPIENILVTKYPEVWEIELSRKDDDFANGIETN